MASSADDGFVEALAKMVGASPPGLRLLISLLLSYPFAFAHRALLHGKSATLQHIFFILAGSYIGYFNYGVALFHGYVCILVHYIILVFAGGTLFSVIFAFTFQLTYLLIEYYRTESEQYDINWTIPHCVLTLRLIGQVFDVYDGARQDEELSSEQKATVLKRAPSLLESAGHVFYPATFMIGPQFPLRRYMNFVEGRFGDENGNPPASVKQGMVQLLIGIFYVAIFQTGAILFTGEYMLSREFEELGVMLKMLYIGCYGRVLMYKYVSVWTIVEGSCTVAGLSYNGKDANGQALWNGCENIDIGLFEKGYKFGHVISAFNKCTNKWIAQNVYKRLKFLGNQKISHFAALMFLAVWHGLHTGYYMCFFMEFIVMIAEKQFETLVEKIPWLVRWHNSSHGSWFDYILCKFFVFIYFGYCMLPFGLLRLEEWSKVYGMLYYHGTVFFLIAPLFIEALRRILVKKPVENYEDRNANRKVD